MKPLLQFVVLFLVAFCMLSLVSCQKKIAKATPLNQSSDAAGGITEADITKDLSTLLAIYLPDKDYMVLIESAKTKEKFYDLKTVTKSFAGSGFNPTAKRICQGIEKDFNECVATLLKKEGCAKVYKENDFQYFACGCK
jgi:hypothetical protein